MEFKRAETREVNIGGVIVGGRNKIAVQSMTNTDTTDAEKTAAQVKALADAGCDIVRVAVYNKACLPALKAIKAASPVPIVADVHFDYKLAIGAIENGADKLRINPGNISRPEHIELVAHCARMHKVPIRVGANSGSLEKELLSRYGVGPKSVCASVEKNVRLLEKQGFDDIVLSAKCSDVRMMTACYEMLSKQFNYPLHLGVTEAGGYEAGTVKSAVGIGALLLKGIGDTIRVSLTGDPIKEVSVARSILMSLGLLKEGIEIISCPTCGRTRVNVEGMVNEVMERTKDIKTPITVAVMGCVVNGPGEAREADIGIAGGDGRGAVFKKGELLCTAEQDKLVDILVEEIHNIQKERQEGPF